MNEITQEITQDPERQYAAAMDSVNLLNGEKPQGMSDDEWRDCINRNVEHLKIMIAKGIWTDEQITPLRRAIQR